MSVSGELLCSFELLKPLDSSALKNHIKKGRNKRNSILNSPVRLPRSRGCENALIRSPACDGVCSKFLMMECILGRKKGVGLGCFVIH